MMDILKVSVWLIAKIYKTKQSYNHQEKEKKSSNKNRNTKKNDFGEKATNREKNSIHYISLKISLEEIALPCFDFTKHILHYFHSKE